LDTQRAPFATRPRPLVLALSIAFASIWLAAPVQAQAAATQTTASANYSIASGPLDQMLNAIGKTSGRSIVFDPALIKGLKASAVKGLLSVEDALKQALTGTGLSTSVAADGKISVVAAKRVKSDVAVGKDASDGHVAQLQAINVVAKRDQAETSFKVDRTSTSTRSDADLMDLPTSVSVVTADALESKQATSVEDAIADVAGVVYTASPQGTPTYSIRGYGQTETMSNGLTNSAAANTNVMGVERIEVLKGPQAILAGSGALGGAVNIVTKKPQAQTIRELTLQYASNGDKTVGVDLSGALTKDKKLTYRLIASGETQNNTADGYEGDKATYVMPELRWKDDVNDAIIGYSTDNRRIAPTAYTFAYDGYVQDMPSGILGDDSDGFAIQTQNYFYNFSHKFNKHVTLNSKMQASTYQLSLRMYSPLGLTGTDTIAFSGTHMESRTETINGDHYLEWKFNTGPVRHKLTTGINHESTNYSQKQWEGDYFSVNPYTGDVGSVFKRIEGDEISLDTQNGTQFGVYLMDLMTWNKFNVLLGARRSKYESESDLEYIGSYSSYGEYASPSEGMWETSPMAGLVYNITPTVSAYTSYAEAFNPQMGYTICDNGQSLPMRTRNREVGMKFDLFDSKFSVTTSAFSLDQLNSMQYSSSGACYMMMPAQRTKGVEVDMAGRLAPGWNLLFNATYNTIQDVSGYYEEYAARPKKKASLWTTYDFQNSFLHGWGVGFGVSAWDSSLLGYKYSSSSSEPAKLAGAARTDASVSYKRKDWSVTLGVKNIFDRQLYDFATTDVYVPKRPGRSATLTYKINL